MLNDANGPLVLMKSSWSSTRSSSRQISSNKEQQQDIIDNEDEKWGEQLVVKTDVIILSLRIQ
jgi:hypothetical protein